MRPRASAAVEIGAGGYPGSHHCPVDELLGSEPKRNAYRAALDSRGLILSALSCHYEPLSPDPALAKESDAIFRKAVRLASRARRAGRQRGLGSSRGLRG